MNKENILRIIAIFMIHLIVSFPIAFAQATGEEGTEIGLEVTVNKLEITDTNDNGIRYFTPGDALLYLELNIYKVGLSKDKVSLFFVFDMEERKPKDCIPFNDLGYTRCRWYNVNYNLQDAAFNEEVIVHVIDGGNELTKTVELKKDIPTDTTKPVISNLKITDVYNNEITGWISGNIVARVYVDIADAESGLDMGSIEANLGGLNIERTYLNENPDSCVDNNGGVRCRFDVEVKLEESKVVNLEFKAGDKAGNKETKSLPYTFRVDNVGPQVTDIKTDIIYNGMSYVKEIENKILAGFMEGGSGLDRRDVVLDLSDLGVGLITANKCENNVCYWENVAINVGGGIYKVKVSPETKDKLGNKLVGSFEKDVRVDIKAPVVEEINVGAVSGSRPLIDGYIQSGNGLLVTAKVYEPTILTAVGDFSKFITNAEEVPGYCTQDGNYWDCTWETSEIDVTKHTVGKLLFNFTDAIGNSDVQEYGLIVFAVEEEEADYWQCSVGKQSPDGIDKEILALYDPYIYFPVKLESKGKDVWPVSVEIGDCVNAEGESYGAYLSSEFGNKPELFNYNSVEPGILPYEIYLKYTLERAEPPMDELPIKCTLNIRSLVDKQRISQIETEEFTVKIPYYYNPLGTLDGSIQDEIDRVSNNWLVKGQWLEDANKVLNLAKMICRSINSIYEAWMAFAFIIDVLGGKCSLSMGIYGCDLKVGIFKEGYSVTKSTMDRIYNTYAAKPCKLLNCQLWESEWGINKETGEKASGFLGLGDLSRQKWILASKTYSKQGYWGNVDPQHSLILSAIYLCLPGVIYNLQKARVIDCQYVNCLKQSAYSTPVQYCASQRSYGYCKFVYGEMFNLIPFAAAISYLSQNVKKFLSHPIGAAGGTVGIICRTTCSTPNAVGCAPCTLADTFNFLLNVLCDLGFGKNCEPLWNELKVDDSICKGINKEAEEEEEGEPVV